jgi:hypothetical protein
MLQEFAEHLVKYFANSVAAIGVGTLAVMGMSFFIARLNRLHTALHSDSKDRRDTAYNGLQQAVENFTKQTLTDLPLILRSDWAHMAHSLAASESLAAGISSDSQREIWATQLDYCRKLTYSGLQTLEASLEVGDEESDTISRFNHRPSEPHVAAVVRWALEMTASPLSAAALTDEELRILAQDGLPLLADRVRAWRVFPVAAQARPRSGARVTALHS